MHWFRGEEDIEDVASKHVAEGNDGQPDNQIADTRPFGERGRAVHEPVGTLDRQHQTNNQEKSYIYRIR